MRSSFCLNKIGAILRATRVLISFALLSVAVRPCFSQANPNLQTYFKQYVGLDDEQIRNIRAGQALAKTLHSRMADEIFVFGAVYINADPKSYLGFSRDFDRMRTYPGYLALNSLGKPPQLSELKDFTFDNQDIQDLEHCKPGKCQVQIPGSAIEKLQGSMSWEDPGVGDKINQLLQETVVDRIGAYQREGNSALVPYNDKRESTDVAKQFKYMLTYSDALPKYLPDFYNYLLTYPSGKPDNVEDSFYWAKVKFGLKPTLRIIHVLTLHGTSPTDPIYAIAEKQLYSDHYFQTALDLTFCVHETLNTNEAGFYLIKVMGSEQAGLTGVKGSIVRKVAVDRTASSLEKSLATIKTALEKN